MLKKFAMLIVDICTVLFSMGVVAIIVSFTTFIVLDMPAKYTFDFMAGFLLGSYTLLALALLILWRKDV